MKINEWYSLDSEHYYDMASCDQTKELFTKLLDKYCSHMTVTEFFQEFGTHIDDLTLYYITGDYSFLDVNEEYPGLEKYYPVITFTSDTPIEDPLSFINSELKRLGFPTVDANEVENLEEQAGSYDIVFVYKNNGWTWVDEDGADPPKYNLCEWSTPLGRYITGAHETR